MFAGSSAINCLYPGYSLSKTLLSEHVVYLQPQHPNFNHYWQPFNRRIKLRPGYIAVCYSEQGVQQAVRFAKTHNLPIAIKSGGHSFEGFSLNENGLVIDLSQLNRLTLTPDNRLYAQPGCRLAELYDYLLPRNRILPVGSCGGVALGGLTLGGGYGLFSRKWGLTCDSLIGLRIVDGHGNLHDSVDNPELLWACRGGGNGNFGIVTELRYKTFPSPENLSRYRIKFYRLSGGNAMHLAERWFTQTAALPSDAFSAFVLNGSTLTILVTYFQRESIKLVASVVSRLGDGANKVSTVKTQPIAQAVKTYYGRSEPLHFKNVSAGFYDGFSDIALIAEDVFSDIVSAKGMIFQINTLGAAIADRSLLDGAAYAHRLSAYLGELQSYWDNDTQTNSKLIILKEVQAKLHNAGIDRHYRNYPSLEIKNYAAAYYGEKNLRRLQTTKQQLDPDNVFMHPQCIALDQTSE